MTYRIQGPGKKRIEIQDRLGDNQEPLVTIGVSGHWLHSMTFEEVAEMVRLYAVKRAGTTPRKAM